ncbi:MAG: YopT-type cysteine protease domain-containing protein [Acetobacteraceae bacterium]
MGFTRTAIYRNNSDFDQAAELKIFKGQELFSSFVTLNDNTRFGICLALSLNWISNKVLPLSQRVRGANSRMVALQDDFVRTMKDQDRLAKAWASYSGSIPNKLKYILLDSGLNIPQPVSEIKPLTSALDVNTVIVETLDQHVPYLLVYYWNDGKGHAVVCYRTTNHWIIFDPNCGEMRATASQLHALWKAYWQDVQTEFGSVPAAYGLASVGVVPSKKKKKCLLATAACASIGLPEECDELERLRQFRDEVVARLPEGRESIAQYYAMAQDVVPSFHDGGAQPLLQEIYQSIVRPAAASVAASDNAEAIRLFHTVLRQMAAVRTFGLGYLTH